MSSTRSTRPRERPVSSAPAGRRPLSTRSPTVLDRAVLTATVRIPIFDREVAAVRVTEAPVAALDEITAGEGDEPTGDAESRGGAESFPLGLVPERERDDRYRGYDPAVVNEIGAAHDGPVLVKADGARTRLLKAPNEREPQIPASADRVVPVASAGAVGEPLTAETVHRPERVAAITDAAVGDEITPELVGRVLAHEEGGLKGIPGGATAIPLVNAVDDADDEAAAREIARVVHERADVPRVVLARMIEGRLWTSSSKADCSTELTYKATPCLSDLMERTVTVVPEAGLHARPASKLVQTANRFDADVSIGRANDGDDGLVRADSMLSVSGLNVGHGESVRVVAEGAEAADALDAVCDLLTSEVEEGKKSESDDTESADDGGDPT